MVRFQLRVDQVVAMLECTLTSEARGNIKDDQIVEKSLGELKKITQECAMLRMSRGDDVARNLLKLVEKKPRSDAEGINESNLETAAIPFKTLHGNKRRRLTQN